MHLACPGPVPTRIAWRGDQSGRKRRADSNAGATVTPRQIASLLVLSSAVFLVAVDGTVISVAVPALTEELQPSYTQVLWIGDIYSFVLAGLLVTMGNVGDRIGRKKLLLLAATGFGIMSAAAAFAPTAELLIVARALQGLAGAGLMPSTLSLIRTVFTDERTRTRAVGIWSASGAAGAAAGPAIAGILLEHYFWGSVLLINLPVVVVIVGLGALVLPEARNENRPSIDLLSVVLSTVGILAGVYGITELAHSGPGFLPAYLALAVSVPLLVIFLRRQRILPTPLLDLSLFANVRFSAAVSAQFVTVFANTGVLFFLPIYLRQVQGFTALQAGIALLPVALVSIVVSPLNGNLTRRFGSRRVLLAGLGFACLGLLLLGLTAGLPYWTNVAPLAMLGLAFAMVLTTAANLVLTSASEDRVGAATGVSETSFELGSALGIAIMGSLLTVAYYLTTGTQAELTAATDAAAFTSSLTWTAIVAACALSVVTLILWRVLPTSATPPRVRLP